MSPRGGAGMRRRALGGAVAAGFAALVAAGAAAANEPRSAIPWLSQSLQDMPPVTRPAPRPARPPGDPAAAEIAVTPLEDVSRDAVGLMPPGRTGFARDLWGPTSALRVRSLILAHPDRGVPAARGLFRKILLAEADPPPGSGASGSVLVARIDRLLEAGALEEAAALLEAAGAGTPELFVRWFDVGLLRDEANPPCEALQRNPALSPTLPARIFCLARGGDWNAAEITLTLGRNVGEVGDAEELALARFLDPVIFEETPDPGPPEPLTPLDFLLREAVGLPRPAGPLPVAFLHGDLADYQPMRVRITAGERLVLSGGIPAGELFAAYRAGEPAASGGVWDRAEAVQALDAALDGEDGAALGDALAEADAALAARGLRGAFAGEYADALTALDAAALPAAARPLLAELLLLGGEAVAAARVVPAAMGADEPAPGGNGAAGEMPDRDGAAGETPDEAALAPHLAIAGLRRIAPAAAEAAAGPRARAALEGLTAGPPPDQRAERLAALIDEGRQGEAILGALELLADGPAADPPALRAALHTLVRAGQRPAARQIALETLLLDPAP